MAETRPIDAPAPGVRGCASAGHDPLEGVRADGTITTGAHRSRFAPAFAPVLERAVEHLKALSGSASLCVYGSVATGCARVGSSDVDLVTIGLDTAASSHMSHALTAEFAALCRGVEVGVAQRSDYDGPGDQAHGNRVFLRHYCVHLTGPDLGDRLPNFAADAAAARGFNGDIGRCAQRWRYELQRAPEPGLLGRRLARKTLLAVAGLVSIHDALWTTDRWAAARRWASIRPHLAASLDTLVAWGLGAATAASRADVQRALDGVVADVVVEFRACIGLWTPADAAG